MPRGKALKEVDLLNRKYKKYNINGGSRTGRYQYESEDEEEEEEMSTTSPDTRFENLNEEELQKLESIFEQYPDIDENTATGYDSRTRYIRDNIASHTNDEANEVGFLNEYYFSQMFNKEWNPIKKYITPPDSDTGFFASADFIDDNEAIEIKTVRQKNYWFPRFLCPIEKVNKILALKKPNNYIYWAIYRDKDLDYKPNKNSNGLTFSEVISNREQFMANWVYYDLSYLKNDIANGNVCITNRIKDTDNVEENITSSESQQSYVFRFNMMKERNEYLQDRYREILLHLENEMKKGNEVDKIYYYTIKKGPKQDFECPEETKTYKSSKQERQENTGKNQKKQKYNVFDSEFID